MADAGDPLKIMNDVLPVPGTGVRERIPFAA